ncbi:helix-turn-helix domain-containing protein [Nocardia asteroides]|uniref:helix-turn-helix domain-containing protein n=1 Tax=Nocardia asteroides TaxID=1824 RepID=UPI001E4DD2CF|nr:helix-turn-helix domain-containing protein [Nocardia asteroides]UGT53404.1 helix-turn-helix domain-containing protein [Nocardia asteroides]
MSDERSIDDAVSTPNTEITALAQQVATARGKLPLQHDTALYDALSDAEIRAERELAEWIRAQRRKQRRRAVADELAAEKRDRRIGTLIRRTDEADARWHRKALAARRRVSSADARLAQLYRRAEWSSRALIGVVVLGMVWAGVNVQHNLVPSGDMSDPLYWLSFGIEAMISIPIITIMVAATTAARWGRELERGKVLVFELALLGTTVALNAGPHLAAGAWGRAAEFSIAPVMVGVVIWLHAWVSARYALLIESASVELPGDAGASFARSERISDDHVDQDVDSVGGQRLSAVTASPADLRYAPTEQAAASASQRVPGARAHHPDAPASGLGSSPFSSAGVRPTNAERIAVASQSHADDMARDGFAHVAASFAAEVNSPATETHSRTTQADPATPMDHPSDAVESAPATTGSATSSPSTATGGVASAMADTTSVREAVSTTSEITGVGTTAGAGTTDASAEAGAAGASAAADIAGASTAAGIAPASGGAGTADASTAPASTGISVETAAHHDPAETETADTSGLAVSTGISAPAAAHSAATAEADLDDVAADALSENAASADQPVGEVIAPAKIERKTTAGRRPSVDKAAAPGTLELIHKAAADHRRNGDYARTNGTTPTVRRIPVTAAAQATAGAATGSDPVPEATAHAGSVARDRNGDTAASTVMHTDPQPAADEPEQLTLTADLDAEREPARERELTDSTPASVADDEPARRELSDPASVVGNEPARFESHQRPETESAPSEPITQAQPTTAERHLAKPAPKKPLRKIESSDLVEDEPAEPVEPEDIDDYDFDDDNEVRALARQIATRSPLRLTLDQIEEILELTDQSWSARSIGAEVGVSGTTVTNIVEFARKIRQPYAFTG